jgi:hypothetical protein
MVQLVRAGVYEAHDKQRLDLLIHLFANLRIIY